MTPQKKGDEQMPVQKWWIEGQIKSSGDRAALYDRFSEKTLAAVVKKMKHSFHFYLFCYAFVTPKKAFKIQPIDIYKNN
jgi:hypothetical protein